MAAPPTTQPTDPVCLHCSPARTVWRRRRGDRDVIEKIYTSGSLADAERECAMGRAAAGAGVVDYLDAAIDSDSHRPAVTLRFALGENLEQVVARRGALPAREALQLLEPVAATLERLHRLRTPGIPNGLCHGDVKPQNLLSTADSGTLLLDFEHASAIGGAADQRAFTGGTSAFSPPEAHLGVRPDAGFDVFGFGATLAFLLDGGTQRRLPQHPLVEALVRLCCAASPEARPPAAEVRRRCEHLCMVLADDEHERTLHDAATGRLAVRPTDDADARAVLWHRRARLLQRLPHMLEPRDTLPGDPAATRDELEQVHRVLSRFPRNEAALQRRRRLLEAVGTALGEAAERLREDCRKEHFDAALRRLRTLEAVTMSALASPGGLAAIAKVAPGRSPGPMQRAPLDFVRRLVERAEQGHEELREAAAEVSTAEAAFDLQLAERHIDALAREYGGTSPTVAERRDQLHRLGFYLDRVARAETNVERVGPLWDPDALRPLHELVRRAGSARRVRTRGDSGNGAVGLRSLQLTLASVAEEFPHVTSVPPALTALTDALLHLTDQAWQQLRDAEQRLRVVPVPVRPLQLALGRLDTFRMLEAFVDRPDRPRSELVDGIERLRLGLEQARSARDRLAENAEHALARGHWTTGLFDMERAVARLNPHDDSERREADRLRERLQAARRTKKEIEAAERRNVSLSARYTTLQEDDGGTSERAIAARVQCLLERRDCLLFLSMHVPNDRAALYREDLRTVETALAVERADDAERRLAQVHDPAERLRLAHETIDVLGATDSSTQDHSRESPDRIVELLATWRRIAASCQQEIDRSCAERRRSERRRRHLWIAAIVAIVAGTVALGIALEPLLFAEPVMAGSR